MPKTEEELALSQVSLLTYLERYGGYRGLALGGGPTRQALASSLCCQACTDWRNPRAVVANQGPVRKICKGELRARGGRKLSR